MNAWRIGAVSYLNSKPLIHELQRVAPASQISFDLPSRLARRLNAGHLDVALVPSIETVRRSDYQRVSDACIACRGPVWSVKLLSRVDLDRINTLALDEGSLTSAVLVQILLKQHYGVAPNLRSLSIDHRWQDDSSDAVLIIGDRAMNPGANHPFTIEVDLGRWWYDWTGLPFVFALWLARPGLDESFQALDQALAHARDHGLANISLIAERQARHYGLTIPQCMDYFQNYLHFQLGEPESQGLAMFQDLAREMEIDAQTVQFQYGA